MLDALFINQRVNRVWAEMNRVVSSFYIDLFKIMCISWYGVDPDGPVPDLETDNIVIVPESTIQVTDNHTNEIRVLVPNPLNDDENHGIGHYLTIDNYLKMR